MNKTGKNILLQIAEEQSHDALELWQQLQPGVSHRIHLRSTWNRMRRGAFELFNDSQILQTRMGQIAHDLEAAGFDPDFIERQAYLAARTEMLCAAKLVPAYGVAQADLYAVLGGRVQPANIVRQDDGSDPNLFAIDLPEGWDYRPVLAAYTDQDKNYRLGEAVITNERHEPVLSVSYNESHAYHGSLAIMRPHETV